MSEQVEQVKQIIGLAKSLKSKSDWGNPNMLPLYKELFAIVVDLLKSLFGCGSKDLEVMSSSLLKELSEITSEMKAIRVHLESTCLSKEEFDKIIANLKQSLADDIAAEIPGQLRKMKALSVPIEMTFERVTEEK